MIDLHCHSIYSDGEFSPNVLLTKAEQLKLKYFAITDHNNSLAYKNIDSSIFSGKLITGVEIATSFNKQIIEILGYGMDVNEINEWFMREKKKEPEYAQIVCDRLISIFRYRNIKYTKSLPLNSCVVNNWNTGTVKKMIYDDLLKYESNKVIIGTELQSFSSFNKIGLNNPNSVLFIDENTRFLTIKQTTDLIHRNGGLCFLAHAYQYDVENHNEFLDKLVKEADIDGLEVQHSSFSKKQIEEITKFADERGLYKSGGSDFHGKLKPGIELGLNMTISDDIIKPWIRRIKAVNISNKNNACREQV